MLCLVQPSTATMPSRASMPTAIWPGHCLQAALTRPGSFTATVPRMTRFTPASNQLRDALDGADAAAQLGRHLDRLQDLDHRRAIDRMALDRAVEIDQVQPFAAGMGEGLGLGGRAVVEHRGARHVAAQQAHALAVLQIDRGKQGSSRRGFSASGARAPPSLVGAQELILVIPAIHRKRWDSQRLWHRVWRPKVLLTKFGGPRKRGTGGERDRKVSRGGESR